MTRRVAVREAPPPDVAAPPRRQARARGTAVAIAAAVVAAGVGLWGLAGEPWRTGAAMLTIYDHGSDRVVYERELRVGDRFSMTHTHSVTLRPVVETFSVASRDALAIEELWFDEPGPNLPAGPEPLGDGATTFLSENGAFRVLHHGHEIGTLPLLVGGDGVDHVLEFADGERLRLLDVIGAGSRAELLVRGP